MANIDELQILEVAEALGIEVSGLRFKHACKDHHRGGTYAILNPDTETYHCFVCGRHSGVEGLIADTLGQGDTPASRNEVAQWLNTYFPGTEVIDEEVEEYASTSTLTDFVHHAHDNLMNNSQHGPVKEWLLGKYGFNDQDIQKYAIGYVHEFDYTTYDSHTLRELGLCNIAGAPAFEGYVVFPYYYKGRPVYLSARFPGEPPANQPKHRKLSMSTDARQVPLFNFDRAQNLLRKHTAKMVALVVCESETDAIAVTKIGLIAVAMGGAANRSAYKLTQIRQLAANASDVVLLYDNDFGKKKNTGVVEAQNTALALYEYSVDAIISTLDHERLGVEHGRESIDITECVLAGPSHVSVVLEGIKEDIEARNTYIKWYINTYSAVFASKERVRSMILSNLVTLPAILQDQYIKLICKLTGAKDKLIRQQLDALRKLRVKNNNTIELSLESEDNTYFFNHDYWFDKTSTDTMFAQKMVYAPLKVKQILDNGSEKTVVEKCPVLVRTSVSQAGVLSLSSVKRLDIEELNVFEKNMLPLDASSFNATSATWSISSSSDGYTFDDFLKANANLHVDGFQLASELTEFIRKYIHLKDERYAEALALYVMMTYIYMLYPSVPYLHINGVRGSGKSTLGLLLSKLMFMPTSTVMARESHIYREAHANRGVIVFDEEEGLTGHKTSERAEALLAICNATYTREGAAIPRYVQESKGNMVCQYFYAFCPKVFIGINMLKDTLSSRCIKVETEPVPRMRRSEFPIFEVDLFQLTSQLQSFRNRLYVWSLSQFYTVRKSYEEVSLASNSDDTLLNRDGQLWTPLLAIANTFADPSFVDAVQGLNKRLYAARETRISTSDWAEVFYLVYNTFIDQTTGELVKSPFLETGCIVSRLRGIVFEKNKFLDFLSRTATMKYGINFKYVSGEDMLSALLPRGAAAVKQVGLSTKDTLNMSEVVANSRHARVVILNKEKLKEIVDDLIANGSEDVEGNTEHKED